MVRVPRAELAEALRSARAAAHSARETVRQARETVAAAHRVVLRADRVTAELEEPLRALAPGLARLANALDDDAVDDLPETVRRVQEDLVPVLSRLSAMAAQTERMASLLDDATRGVPGLAGLVAGLGGRRRPDPRVITVEQVDPPER